MTNRYFMLILAGAILAGPALCPAAPDAAAVTAAMKEVQQADWGSMPAASIKVIEEAVVAAPGDRATQKLLQKQMTAMLSSEAKGGAKSWALRKLSMIATPAAVPAIAALLTDKELSHMARYALQRIGGPRAVKAIRDAVRGVTGRQKAGMINSLGVMRDTEAVASLVRLLGDSDASVVSAAATALGRIGTSRAAAALGAFRSRAPKSLAVVAANAYLDAAEALVASGKRTEAAAIYRRLESDKVAIVRVAAFRGLAAASPAEAMPRLLKALDGQDAAMRGVAAELMSKTPGVDATKAFAAGLRKLRPDGQITLLRALATRKDPAARPEVARLVRASNQAVRVAAVATLGSVGCADDVKTLAGIAASKNDQAAGAARVSLTKLTGSDIDAAVAGAIRGAAPKVQAVLIDALAARQARQAVPSALKCTTSRDANVRIAAFNALGQLAGPECTAPVAKLMVAVKDHPERGAAEKALCNICTRGREKSADAVIRLMRSANATGKQALLRALLHAGGPKALACVAAAAKGRDENVAKEAVRNLAKWRDTSPAPILLELATSSSSSGVKILSVRGVITMAGAQKDTRAAMGLLTSVRKVITRADEKKLLLGTLGNMRVIEALRMVVPYIEDSAVTGEASSAAVKLAQNIDQRKQSIRQEVIDAMGKVAGFCKDKRLVGQAKSIIKNPPRRRR